MRYSFSAFALFFFFLFSCNPCKDVSCLNGGICNDGNCDCPDAFKGPDCSIHKNPRFVKFLEVEVFNIPPLNPEGEPWDENGSTADIVVVMAGKRAGIDFRTHVSYTEQNATGSAVNLGYPITITDFDYDTNRTIGVYDKDGGSGEEPLELICAFEWNIDSVSQATEYSPFLIFSESNCPEIHLKVQYQYVN